MRKTFASLVSLLIASVAFAQAEPPDAPTTAGPHMSTTRTPITKIITTAPVSAISSPFTFRTSTRCSRRSTATAARSFSS